VRCLSQLAVNADPSCRARAKWFRDALSSELVVWVNTVPRLGGHRHVALNILVRAALSASQYGVASAPRPRLRWPSEARSLLLQGPFVPRLVNRLVLMRVGSARASCAEWFEPGEPYLRCFGNF
jgi:hypothetical protein